jgi:anti-sigma regulatory factor (Ser/Thr protein kinase)
LRVSTLLVFDFDLRLVPDVSAPAAARRALAGLRTSLGPDATEAATLLLSEVVTNAVRHAGLDDVDTIRVHVRLHPGVVRVDVSDPGSGFDPERDRIEEPDAGWGLRLLDRLATRWGVERGARSTVWFEVATQRQEQHDDDPRFGDEPSG